MQNILNIISVIIVSVGGTGVIILGISKWIGKILLDEFSQEYKIKCEKELETYKSKINVELNKLDKIEEKALYITKVNYDNEYKIYMEIWPKLVDCVNATMKLYPRGLENVPIDEKELEMYKEDKYNEFVKCYMEFYNCIEKYAPFYEEEFYNDLNIMKEISSFIGNQYQMYEFEVKYNESFKGCRDLKITVEERKEIKEKQQKLLDIKEKLLIKIRNYLNGLKLREF